MLPSQSVYACIGPHCDYIYIFVIEQCLTHQRQKSSVQVEIKFNPNFEAKKRLYMYSVVFHY